MEERITERLSGLNMGELALHPGFFKGMSSDAIEAALEAAGWRALSFEVAPDKPRVGLSYSEHKLIVTASGAIKFDVSGEVFDSAAGDILTIPAYLSFACQSSGS